jgi:hypothetical protein
MPLPSNYKDQIIQKLNERGAMPKCELCGHNDWSVVEQAVTAPISDLSGTFRIPQPQIPCAGLICNHCGNLRLFALGALGFDMNAKQ